MKKLLLLLAACNCFAQAPTIEWQKSIGGSQTDLGNDIKQTNDGGYVVVGSTFSDNMFEEQNYRGSYDIYVVKMNATGNIEWKKTLGGSGYDVGIRIWQTSDSGYIISGYTDSNDGDITSNHGNFDSLVIKLDNAGNTTWINTYGGTGIEYSFDIIPIAGGYLFSGNTYSTDGQVTASHGNGDGWIVKINDSGVLQWQQPFGGSADDFIHKIIPTTDNNYMLVGHTASNDGDVSGNHGGIDAWVAKITNSGAIIWQKTFGGLNDDYLYCIEQTADGNYILSGETATDLGDMDAWIMKLTANGLSEWQKIYGGTSDDSAPLITQTSDGNYLFAGRTASTDGDPVGIIGEQDVWLVKMNNTGEILWQKMYGGSSSENINAFIRTSDNGFAFLAPSSSNNGDLSTNAGGLDSWIVKLNAELLGLNAFSKNELTVYPVPALASLTIKMPDGMAIDAVSITELSGKIIATQAQHSDQVNIQNLASGVYMLEVTSNSQTYHAKFVKQ